MDQKAHIPIITQLRDLLPTLSVICAAAIVVFGAALFAREVHGIPIRYLTADPASLVNGRFYMGIISNIGMLIWAAAAGICFFSSAIVRGQGHDSRIPQFLLCSGLLTVMLCLDDMLMVHEQIFPDYFGVQENNVYVVYLVLLLLYLFFFRTIILRGQYLLLIIAFGFFGISVVVDQLPFFRQGMRMVEEGAKFIGIVSWFAYFARFSGQEIQHEILRKSG